MKHEHNLPGQSLRSIKPGSGFCFERGGWAYIKTDLMVVLQVSAVRLSNGSLQKFHRDSRVFPLDIEARSNP